MMKPMRLMLLLVVLFLAACQAEPALQETVYPVRGELVGVLYDGQALRIRHEEIPGYMAAMRMDFRLAEGTTAEGLQPGDKLAFEFIVTETAYTIRNLEKLPPDTPLELNGMRQKNEGTMQH